MEKWMVYAKRADFNALAEEFGIDPVVARILVTGICAMRRKSEDICPRVWMIWGMSAC